jgi:hypothetical protein
MPWQSGQYYLFNKLFIRAVVPRNSGIYALYNCHHEVFIAESSNLRDSLLRLYTNMLRLGFDRPTGFTFELCPAESRRKRLKQLVAEHEVALAEQPSNVVLYG